MIQMVDLRSQYLRIKNEIDESIQNVLMDSAFIKGTYVASFEKNFGTYLNVDHVVGVGNGTDALQIALMALGIGPGDEVIAPSFTFVATAEAVALLGATPVFADVDPDSFNLTVEAIEPLITDATKAIVPVHLYGQPAEMQPIMQLAERHGLRVIEDCAQAVGSVYQGRAAGTIGDIGTFSFFPSKNLGCFGDGGAVVSNDSELADHCRLIASHGSKKKYHNEVIGVNSRLDGLQAAVLDVKLRHLDNFNARRKRAADLYDTRFAGSEEIIVPARLADRTHVFHQYTIRIAGDSAERRDAISADLKQAGIPHAVYYPIPVHRLPVYTTGTAACRYGDMEHTESATREVISLPMHTELSDTQIDKICAAVLESVHRTSARVIS